MSYWTIRRADGQRARIEMKDDEEDFWIALDAEFPMSGALIGESMVRPGGDFDTTCHTDEELLAWLKEGSE